MRRPVGIACFLSLCVLPAMQAKSAVPGFVEDFPASGGTASFFSGATLDNPGTGGVGGAGDGYLRISRSFPGNFGAATDRPEFTGDLLADGVTGFSFWLNDVGADQPFAIHFCLGTPFSNFWSYNVPFSPPENQWGFFEVDFTNPTLWTQIHGTGGSFEQALRNSQRFLVRHDLPPFVMNPDDMAGEMGLDRITVVPEPASCTGLAVLTALVLRRRGAP